MQNSTEKQQVRLVLEGAGKLLIKPRRGRPLKPRSLEQEGSDPNALAKKPTAMRLRQCVDQAIRAGSAITGVPIQDIIQECVESQYERVIRRHLQQNQEAFDMMKDLLETAKKG